MGHIGQWIGTLVHGLDLENWQAKETITSILSKLRHGCTATFTQPPWVLHFTDISSARPLLLLQICPFSYFNMCLAIIVNELGYATQKGHGG